LVYLLGADEEFNSLAAAVIQGEDELPVYWLGRAGGSRPVVETSAGHLLFSGRLPGSALARRYLAGARLLARPAGQVVPPGHELLFTGDEGGRVRQVGGSEPAAAEGTVAVLLGPAPS
jgi:hypothetical protein